MATLGKVRLVVLTLAVLLAGLASFTTHTRTVDAANGCNVPAYLYYAPGPRAVAQGSASCATSGYQKIWVQLRQNGNIVATSINHGWTSHLADTTASVPCVPGALYQALVTHEMNGQRTVTSTNYGRIC